MADRFHHPAIKNLFIDFMAKEYESYWLMLAYSFFITDNGDLPKGGSLGMAAGNGRTRFEMNVKPTFGYSINEHWEVGGSLLLGGGIYANELSTYLEETSTSKLSNSFNWAIEPYARYYFFNRNNWRVGIEGDASVGGLVDVASSGMAVTWGFNFFPVVTYSPKEHWVLIASCGFLGIGLNGVERSCEFGLNVMNGGGSQVGFGFAYQF